MPTRILLVEDNPGDAVIFREKIDASDLDYELVHAKRLSEGLEQLDAGHFDIMMVDLSLPDAHGMEAVIKVREAAPNHPLIVLTGLDDATAAAEAKQQGAVDYLVKWYVDSVSLARYIRYAIAQYKARGPQTPAASPSAPERVTGDNALEVEGTIVGSRAASDADTGNAGDKAAALQAALEGSASAVLIVTADGSVVFANAAARTWVPDEEYPWDVVEGKTRIPRKGQALTQDAVSTTWQETRAWLVTLRPAQNAPAPAPAAAPKPLPEQPEQPEAKTAGSSTAARAAEAALAFVERAQQESAWLADVLRSALDVERDVEVQADLIDILALANQVVREQRDLAMRRGLPVRLDSERKKVMAYADRNLVNHVLRRLIVDAVHEARHDGVALRAAVEGDVSVIEARWHAEQSSKADVTHAALGRSLVERLVQRAGGTCEHNADATGEHLVRVQLPGRPGG